MNKAKLIEALKMAIEAIEEDGTSVAQNTVEKAEEPKKKPTSKKTAKVAEPAEEPEETVEEETTSESSMSAEDVKSMGYNDLKKFAQSLGIKAVGTRDQIVAKVLEALGNADAEEADEAEAEEAVEEKSSKVVSIDKKKSGLKKPAKEEDPVADAVRAEAEDMDITEIAELLQSVGIKASGKKDKMIDLLIGAVKDGKLDFSDDSEEEEVEDAEETIEEEEVDFTEYHSEYDPNGLNDPDSMSKKRAKAVAKKIEAELEAIESGETTEKDIRDFLNTLLNESEVEEYDVDNLDENNLLFLYFEVVKALIDDDGETHEPSDPYVIGEENVCCGHVLSYDEDEGQYICESCGESYEAE